MICGGPIIDFFTMVLAPLGISESSMAMRIPVLILGCFILAYGILGMAAGNPNLLFLN